MLLSILAYYLVLGKRTACGLEELLTLARGLEGGTTETKFVGPLPFSA